MLAIDERFWRKVSETPEGCWEWNGYRDPVSGYGRVQRNKRSLYTHRYAYELMVGPIPAGLEIDHLCRNRACCNPYHLEPVTTKVNQHRSPIAHAGKVACPEGHPYEGANLKVRSDGRRVCVQCRREYMRSYMRTYRSVV